LSDFTDDIAPLVTAVRLVRLRDRVKGTTKLDFGGWLGPMEMAERDVRTLADSLVNRRRKSRGRRKAPESESIRYRLVFFERDFSLWRGIFEDEATIIAKFLSLLADLRLNVSPELEELKSLNRRNDYALHRVEAFTKRLRAIADGDMTGTFEDDFPIYRELLSIADSLQELKARVDEKADDAVRLVGLMSSGVDSQSLMDLMTGEP
jgi:hypothetical protein